MMPKADAKMIPGYADTLQGMTIKKKWRTQSAPYNIRDLNRLDVGDTVRMHPIRTGERDWKEATVKRAPTSGAFYVETTADRHYRRDRRHLRASNTSSHSLPQQRGHNRTADNVCFRETTRQGQSSEVPQFPNGGEITSLKNDDPDKTAEVLTTAPLTRRHCRHRGDWG